MKICVAQTRPFKGNIEKNIETHKKLVNLAVLTEADAVFFPELSITGYEPELARDLATTPDDERFDTFQQISDTGKVILGVGMPVKTGQGIQIGMIIFQPGTPRQTYSKQFLHSDEEPYFICGKDHMILTIDDKKIAPAICYESLLPEHAENAFKNGADIYIASVAKSAGGVEKAGKHFPEIARKYGMPVLMANCVGPCDNFESAGKSAVWSGNGDLPGQLNSRDEGILIYDTKTGKITEVLL